VAGGGGARGHWIPARCGSRGRLHGLGIEAAHERHVTAYHGASRPPGRDRALQRRGDGREVRPGLRVPALTSPGPHGIAVGFLSARRRPFAPGWGSSPRGERGPMLGKKRRIAVMAEGSFTPMDAKTALGVLRYRPAEVVAV